VVVAAAVSTVDCSKPIDQHAACSADSRTFAKRSGGSRELDTRASDEDFDRSSENATDIANISNGAWCLCIVKRSDVSWKYGTLSERKASSTEVIVGSSYDGNFAKLFSPIDYNGKDQEPLIRALDVKS
jgi:hypothetical protein